MAQDNIPLTHVLTQGQQQRLDRAQNSSCPFFAVTAFTGWHDIRHGMVATLGKRRDMVLRQFVGFLATSPTGRRAIDATKIVRRLNFFPLLSRQVVNRHSKFSRTSALCFLAYLFRVRSLPCHHVGNQLLTMGSIIGSIILSFCSKQLFTVLRIPSLRLRRSFFAMLSVIDGLSSPRFFSVRRSIPRIVQTGFFQARRAMFRSLESNSFPVGFPVGNHVRAFFFRGFWHGVPFILRASLKKKWQAIDEIASVANALPLRMIIQHKVMVYNKLHEDELPSPQQNGVVA